MAGQRTPTGASVGEKYQLSAEGECIHSLHDIDELPLPIMAALSGLSLSEYIPLEETVTEKLGGHGHRNHRCLERLVPKVMSIMSMQFADRAPHQLVIDHGYERAPLSTLRQVLWFRIRSATPEVRQISTIYYWLEGLDKKLWALRIHGLTMPPAEMLPGLGAALESASSPEAIKQHLDSTWLFPPHLDLTEIRDARITPDADSITEAVVNYFYRQGSRYLDNAEWHDWLMQVWPRCYRDQGIPNIDQLSHDLPEGLEAFLVDALHFQAGLDTAILGFLSRLPAYQGSLVSLDVYNLIQSSGEPQQHYRMQAAAAFPWLTHELGLEPRVAPDPALLAAVDEGLELIPILIDRYGVSPSAFRRARQLLVEHALPTHWFMPLLWLLNAIPPDQRPNVTTDFSLMHDAIEWAMRWHLTEERAIVERIGNELFADGGTAAVRKLAAWCPLLGKPFSDSDHFLGDLIAHRHGHTESQRVRHGQQILSMHIQRTGLQTYFEAAERWHRAWEEGTAIYANPNATWEPCLHAPMSVGDRVILELYNGRMLEEEGSAMRHCVGSHWRHCMSGHSFIYSLRDQAGQRQSTLHVFYDEARGFDVEEHRGFANGPALPACRESARLLLRWLNEERTEAVRVRLACNQDVLDKTVETEFEALLTLADA